MLSNEMSGFPVTTEMQGFDVRYLDFPARHSD